jgi:hypothetical protein
MKISFSKAISLACMNGIIRQKVVPENEIRTIFAKLYAAFPRDETVVMP